MGIRQIDSEELKIKLDNGEDIVLVDCRERDEWEAGHVAGAEFIPLSDFETGSQALTSKESEIIIMCRSGRRSQSACQFLEGRGFTNLTNLSGGILEWMELGYPIIRD